MRKRNYLIVAAVLLIGLATLAFFGRRSERHGAEELAASTRLVQGALDELAARYNAVHFEKVPRPLRFSAQYADLLVRADGRPVVILAALSDVAKKDGNYLLVLDHMDDMELTFSVQCDPDTAKRAMRRGGPYSTWALVAVVSSVEQSPADERGNQGYVARGKCLELQAVDFQAVRRYVYGAAADEHP
jgi:hypothetical protein